MSSKHEHETGRVVWADLTVEHAEELRGFYEEVVGWRSEPVRMGEYDDFAMTTASGVPAAGICHARGVNADLPPQWLVYIVVDDLDRSMEACTARGGRVVAGPTSMGAQGRYAVIQDPAGASCALLEPAPGES
jgi:predicted enzyme related to lactoylglutathione lyase